MDQDTADRLTAQYDQPPAPGLRRYWMSVVSWFEDWPEDPPFFSWLSGSGCDYRLKASAKANPAFAGLPERTDMSDAGIDPDVAARVRGLIGDADIADELYVSNANVCMLVDAADETSAWDAVRAMYPDMVERFIEPADGKTLTSLAKSGRFGHPNPPGDSAAA